MTIIYFQVNFINFSKRRFRLTKIQKVLTVRPRQCQADFSAALVFAAIVFFVFFLFFSFFAVVAFFHLESSSRKTVAIIA